MARWVSGRSAVWWLCCAALACGPSRVEETETQSTAGASESEASTATTGSTTSAGDAATTTGAGEPSTTGAAECAVAVGPHDEPPVPDPNGCFAITDEAACTAKGDDCVPLFGVPAECSDAGWCAPEPSASKFLGCRPFTICKPLLKVVCAATDTGIHAFFTERCTPPGFGRCEPEFSEPPMVPLPACE